MVVIRFSMCGHVHVTRSMISRIYMITTSVGPVNICYTIATPANPNSKSIDKALPSVIFLHPAFLAQEVFHSQFADPQLRRFNLIALDFRCHGSTTGRVNDDYSVVDAAEDVAKFMDALHLPACHIVGLSLGACTAIQLAISHRTKVLSVFMISPHPETEPMDVIEGLQEIYDYWTEGFRNPEGINEEALHDALDGALQFGFNRVRSKLSTSLMSHCHTQALVNWCPSKFKDFHTATVKFFMNRQPYSTVALASIKCPVRMVHCSADIAYRLPGVELFRDRLQEAGVDVQLHTVADASHFGSVTHAKQIDELLSSFLIANTPKKVPPPPEKVTSPWQAALIRDEESDDETD